MVSNTPKIVNFFLSEISPIDKPWDKHKTECVQVSNAFSLHKNFKKRGYILNQCADWLIYHATHNPNKPLSLAKASFCRDRACPICQWRRSLRWVATMHQQLPAVKLKYPTHRWLFLTLTVRNCHIADLKFTIQAMNKGFNALIRKLKKRLSTIGYVRTTEVTRGQNDTAHPHFHVLLLVPANYFTRNYIKQADWITLWRDALKVNYAPNVDVRTVKVKKNASESVQNAAISHAIAETMKYSIKPSELLKTAQNGNFDWMYDYFTQVKGLRFLSVGGVLKGLIRAEWQGDDETNQDLITVAGDDTNQDTKAEPIEICFTFDRMIWRYKH